ncbi:ribbon-helix-helix domain-containing protein [Heyndrickxia oleronia]|uniref:ribbon-helix-helix domain-containing protein n=1 Tax=Heyndrickxia oleronia TaxID=38875 RepID=UPI00242D4D94|nr:ribbon-helix-helix domain-containing protein [Heyndrickxia oleronia]MCI1763629.1 ribbon-helix-helix domain-containing protein [Heyndrickxia oleronia]
MSNDRIRFSSTIKKELYEALQKHSEKTDVPITKLLDRAVEQFLSKQEKISE